MQIAIDGPAGSGKSTISLIISQKLKINYLDTGAMYRCITLSLLENKIDLNNIDMITNQLEKIDLKIKDNKFYVDSILVDEKIRGEIITNNVSKVASIKEVREFLVKKQQKIANQGDCILDGRDIGSFVLINADYKFFLTADAEVRAKRRYEENKNTDNQQDYETILHDIIKRDEIDTTRKESPLVKAKDAILIDTSKLSIEEVVDEIIKKIK